MPFIIIMQQQPAAIILFMQSQHACSISMQPLSPEVHVTVQPLAVISHLQLAIAIVQFIMGMPFIIMQQEIIAPCIMVIMFCIIEHCILSSQLQVMVMPPSHLAMAIVHRGIIIMLEGIHIAGIGMPPIEPIISLIRFVIIVLMVISTFFSNRSKSPANISPAWKSLYAAHFHNPIAAKHLSIGLDRCSGRYTNSYNS